MSTRLYAGLNDVTKSIKGSRDISKNKGRSVFCSLPEGAIKVPDVWWEGSVTSYSLH